MIDPMVLSIIIIAGVLFVFLIVIAIIQVNFARRSRQDKEEISETIEGLVAAIQQEQVQSATVSERISQITPVSQAMNSLQVDIKAIGERIASVEKNQSMVHQGVGYLANNTLSNIAELKTLTSGLTEATSAMRSELSSAKNDLTELQTRARSEKLYEYQVSEAISRLESTIIGVQSKSVTSEDMVETVFSKLPTEWQVRDFEVNGRLVRFGLRLPNELILPIEYNWNDGTLLDRFLRAEEKTDQLQIKQEIESVVLQKAKELRYLLDSEITSDFGLTVVPDAVFELCSGIQPVIFQLNVVLVSYSMLVPYLLLVFQTALRSNSSIDLEKLETYLQFALDNVNAIQSEIDGRISQAIDMLSDSRDEIRNQISSINGRFNGLQLGSHTLQPELPSPVKHSPKTGQKRPPTTAILT